ncbi:helix-turn-helix domain-containing protein [Eudoraea chungangensis]|uniref:helix-turn-helix domain-containing protein n=1 Tax=Eudoraea chungangensis TaxID=1481905 RepID=UPI0023EAA8C2|nr:helix-turn-helix domain-containing protein [Eudoraea chungangensis]
MQSLQFIELNPQDFKRELVKSIKEVLLSIEEQKKPKKSIDYLSRKEVASLLKISETSVYRWTKNGRLKSYGLGNRIYYKRHEIDECIIDLTPGYHD